MSDHIYFGIEETNTINQVYTNDLCKYVRQHFEGIILNNILQNLRLEISHYQNQIILELDMDSLSLIRCYTTNLNKSQYIQNVHLLIEFIFNCLTYDYEKVSLIFMNERPRLEVKLLKKTVTSLKEIFSLPKVPFNEEFIVNLHLKIYKVLLVKAKLNHKIIDTNTYATHYYRDYYVIAESLSIAILFTEIHIHRDHGTFESSDEPIVWDWLSPPQDILIKTPNLNKSGIISCSEKICIIDES